MALRLQWMVVLLALSGASVALGDGVYIPVRAVRKIPEIPAQRAVLSWRNGQETLLISSALDSESQKLGWIIPLPAVPKTIEKQTPGALKTLDFCIQPEITHDLYAQVAIAIYAFFVANLVLATLLFKKTERLGFLLVELFIFGVVPSLMLPALGPSRSFATKAANAQVEKTATVGSYQVSILRAEKLDNLNAWLAENGFSLLPSTAGPPVADYISNSWVFAAIKLVRGESGTNAPHPIEMTFASKEPVYPLKLTALAGGSTAFEIFVIANDRAVCRELEVEFCDRFRRDTDHTSYEYEPESDPHYETKTLFVGKADNQTIGHPAICSLMWNKCVLTKCSGTIKSSDMTADIRFDRQPFKAYRQHYYTKQGAFHIVLILFVCLGGSWIAASMITCRARIVEDGGLTRYLCKSLLPAAVLLGIGGAILYVSVPRLAVSEVTTERYWRLRYYAQNVRATIENLLQMRPDISNGTEKEISDSLLQALRERRPEKDKSQNRLLGSEFQSEDTPGNFTVEKSARSVIVRVYDTAGRPMLVEQPIRDAGKQGRGGQGAKDPRGSEPQ